MRLRREERHGTGFVEMHWEIENAGTIALDKLDIQLRLLGPKGEVRKTSNTMLTYEDRVLYPGEVRLARWLFQGATEAWTVGAFVRAI
jgi:hypothetical protein